MTSLNNMPTAHAKWSFIKKNYTQLDSKVIDTLNRFQFRYRLALSFNSISVEGAGTKTEKGYTAFMKLFLAHSAYDVIRGAEKILTNTRGLRIHYIENEKKLANSLRENKKLKELFLNGNAIENETLRENLLRFYASRSDDILCVATAARNSFAHGTLTASVAGLSINAKVNDIEKLAQKITSLSDDIFTKCLYKISNID